MSAIQRYFLANALFHPSVSITFELAFQLSQPELTDSVMFNGSVISVDVTKDEVKRQSMAFQLADTAVARSVKPHSSKR